MGLLGRKPCKQLLIQGGEGIAETGEEQPRSSSIQIPVSPSFKGMYTMEYYSAIKKNTFESVLMRWMKLEPIIQSEVSQKDKDQCSILTHIYGI